MEAPRLNLYQYSAISRCHCISKTVTNRVSKTLCMKKNEHQSKQMETHVYIHIHILWLQSNVTDLTATACVNKILLMYNVS